MQAQRLSSNPAVAAGLEAVLFDVGGTLDADGVPWSAQFHAAYRTRGGARSADAFADAFRAADRELARYPGIAGLGFRATLAAQAELLAPRLPDARAVDLAAVAADVHRAATEIAARNRALLAALRPHLRLAVVSNFTGNVERCLDELGLLPYFELVLDSATIGVAKPDPAIFRRAIDALGVPPGAALMVGDNPIADVLGAARCGLRTGWLAPAERPTPDGIQPTVRIAQLVELSSLLGLPRPAAAPDDAATAIVACTG